MPHPAPAPLPDRSPGRVTRRRLLRSAVLGALGLAPLTACGPVALGGPESYTPPPPGIDDLYRTELLAVLDRGIAGTRALVEDTGATSAPAPELSDALDTLLRALPIQRTALLTGAQYEDEQEAAEDPAPGQTTSPAPADAPTDAAQLIALLMKLRDLAAAASRQVSGSLARPTCAIAAHTEWIARRVSSAADAGEITAAPLAEELEPTREVPDTDPPSIGATSDYHATIERAQQEEWYAGYVEEVLAARVEGEEREQHLERSTLHRERATVLGEIAEEDGAPVVPRQAVYPMPGGTLDAETAGQLPTLLAQGLLIDHTALVGAAPFARRPPSIAAALQEAAVLAPLLGALQPLPGLEVGDPPVTNG